MGIKIRRVPANWQHPKNERGRYIPMSERFGYGAADIKEGLRDGWLKDEPPDYGLDIMPRWTDAECTHLQMYEDISEGTPISPVMPTAEELARWLAKNGASAYAGMTATYEEWLAIIGGSKGMSENQDSNDDGGVK